MILTTQNVEVWERPKGSSPQQAGQNWASISPAVWFSDSASWAPGGGARPGTPRPNQWNTHCGQDVFRFGGEILLFFPTTIHLVGFTSHDVPSTVLKVHCGGGMDITESVKISK